MKPDNREMLSVIEETYDTLEVVTKSLTTVKNMSYLIQSKFITGENVSELLNSRKLLLKSILDRQSNQSLEDIPK